MVVPERDATLLDRVCVDDDAVAFRQLLERHLDRAYGLALRLLRGTSFAEEIVTGLFVTVWTQRKLRPWQDLGFALWLYRELYVTAESRDESGDRAAATGEMILGLPLLYRAVLTLTSFDDMDTKMVAAVLGKRQPMVTDLLTEGRRMLRNGLGLSCPSALSLSAG